MEENGKVVVKDGATTSEYKALNFTKIISMIAVVAGLIVSVGGVVMEQLGAEGGKTAAILGTVITVAAMIKNLLGQTSYGKGRSDEKSAAHLANAKIAEANATVAVAKIELEKVNAGG